MKNELRRVARREAEHARRLADLEGKLPALEPDTSAIEVVRSHLIAQVRALIVQDARVRLNRADAIHQVRVAARRFRSDLRAFGDLFDDTKALRHELGWLADQVAPCRDAEVMLGRLRDHTQRLPAPQGAQAFEQVEPRLLAALTRGREVALETLDSPRYRALITTLIEAVQPRPLDDAPSAQAVLPAHLKAVWRLLRDAMNLLTLETPADDWHAARLLAKRVRYALEALIPAFGAPARRRARALGTLTELLGQHQDCYVAAEYVTALASEGGPHAFALGLLAGSEFGRAETLRPRILKVWPTVVAGWRANRLG